MEELLYEELTERIPQAAFEVHHYFGNGFLEKVHENALAYKLRQVGIECQQQVTLKVFFENKVVVGEYFADLVVKNKIIVEVKTVESLEKIHLAQLKHHLKTTGFFASANRPRPTFGTSYQFWQSKIGI